MKWIKKLIKIISLPETLTEPVTFVVPKIFVLPLTVKEPDITGALTVTGRNYLNDSSLNLFFLVHYFCMK